MCFCKIICKKKKMLMGQSHIPDLSFIFCLYLINTNLSCVHRPRGMVRIREYLIRRLRLLVTKGCNLTDRKINASGNDNTPPVWICQIVLGVNLQFHVWWLSATKRSMIDYNRFKIGINHLMRLFCKLSVLWNNSCYLLFSNTSAMICWSIISTCAI